MTRKLSAAKAFNDHVAPYDAAAAQRAAEYDRLDAATVHGSWRAHLPAKPSRVLDIGAGSGRDALWLAGQGHDVVAIEPAENLRRFIEEKAATAGLGGRIEARDGMLPALESLKEGETFDVISLSAVWQHVAPKSRRAAFNRIAAHLAPGGILAITLREGPVPADRKMYRVSHAATVRLARAAGLDVLSQSSQGAAGDILGRGAVRWTTFVGKKK
jgi:SAM-dependent methyltransferase